MRVAILGAESTGKSTLAASLATHYETLWVPEYLREFVEIHERTPHEHEQFFIAATQIEREAGAARLANRLLFCDTSPLMTAIYSHYYFGRIDAALDTLATTHAYDFTLVTPPDSPWVPDGLQRESAEVRQIIHDRLLEKLDEMTAPYLLLNGNLAARMAQVKVYLG